MGENTQANGPDSVMYTSTCSEVSAPDVNIQIPTLGIQAQDSGPSNQHYETAVAATSEDRQINLLTKSYLARLNMMDDSEDDDLEEYERGDDDPRFPSAIQETVNN